MGKSKPKSWDNVPFQTWEYAEQTKMKHKVLNYYMPVWLKILGSYNKNLNYIDGFCGIGAYHSDEDVEGSKYISEFFGSPVFVIQTIRDLESKGKIKNVNVLIIDEDKKCLENIKTILDFKKLDPDNEINFVHGDFDKKINLLLDKVDNLAPTFFMIDPFGFSLKLSTIRRIMDTEKSEVLLNFMYNAIQRFINIKNPKIKDALEKRFNELFGCDEWKKHIDKRTQDKELALCDLFRKQCKKFVKFVYPYRLSFPDKKMPYYYLFHLSNHRKGCSLMKDSFAKFNMGNLEYKAEKESKPSLFDSIDKRDRGDVCFQCFMNSDVATQCKCKECFIEHFSGRQLLYGDFLDEVIDLVPLTEKSIRKALQDLEKEGSIKVGAFDERKRRGGMNEKDKIIFLK